MILYSLDVVNYHTEQAERQQVQREVEYRLSAVAVRENHVHNADEYFRSVQIDDQFFAVEIILENAEEVLDVRDDGGSTASGIENHQQDGAD